MKIGWNWSNYTRRTRIALIMSLTSLILTFYLFGVFLNGAEVADAAAGPKVTDKVKAVKRTWSLIYCFVSCSFFFC
jgi:hypothetical protein